MDLAGELDAFRRSHEAVVGEQLRYFRGGESGETILLLPGYFVGAESWFAVMGRLEAKHRVLAPDYPAVQSVDALEQCLEGLLDAEGVERAHVVGQSIGALYAQELVRRRGSRVASLVLAHGSLPRTQDFRRVRLGVFLGRFAPPLAHRAQWSKRVAAERPGRDAVDTFWREYLQRRARGISRRDAVAWGVCYADLLARGALDREDFARWGGRVLLVEGADDPLVGAEDRAALRRFHDGAEVVELEAAGHVSPERRPAELAAAVAAFVA